MLSVLHTFRPIAKSLKMFLCRSNPTWSKHWHASRMRPANAFCLPYITQSHKHIVLALASHTSLKCRSICNH